MECAGWFTWSEGHVITRSIYEVKADFFKTLAHRARIRVLELLPDGERSVSELIRDVGREPWHLSQPLGVFRRANVITGWSSDSISRALIRGLHPRPPTSPGHRHRHAVTDLVARGGPGQQVLRPCCVAAAKRTITT